ncbi:type IX secretion system sortase PorU [Flavobacterium algicola]|uniref:type IX secretion system sortase PorU n=1 Tax=Flavobacterium algicola TaxID=556529 RepID=UPI001EFDDBFD|nr:type IX secretion system sortase PorU [Flavobacterium algicola]MCG9794046.1 type IX secretion system sortase PorU [Flavobacterium algicola]
MKKLLFLFILSTTIFSFSQTSGSISLVWNDKTEMNFGDTKLKIPQFSGDSFTYNTIDKSIHYMLKLPDNLRYNESTVQITNITYESISSSQLGDLSHVNIPTQIIQGLSTNTSRDIIQSFLSIAPIIKDGLGFKKVISFNYNAPNQPNTITSNTIANKSNATAQITNSVLASGEWFQFYIEKSGVYKLDKNFIQQLGLNLSNVDPKRIKIYGNGGRMLSLSNLTSYPNDLIENAIQLTGEDDGKFDNNDYILFYGEGTDTWNDESQTSINLFENKSYYYITVQGDNGKRIAERTQPSGNTTLNITTFDDTQYHEVDLYNIANVGRQWFGESFDINNIQEFSFEFPNLVTTTPISIKIAAGAAAFTTTTFNVQANETNVGSFNLSQLTPSNTEIKYSYNSYNGTFTGSDNVKIKLTYNNNSVAGSKGYLDYIQLTAKRNLKSTGKQFKFQYNAAASNFGIGQYAISNSKSISQVWDITDIYNATKYSNSDLDLFTFKANLGEIRKYITIEANDYLTPSKDNNTKIANQNIKGTVFNDSKGQFQDIDYVIITPAFLANQAEKLAAFHRSYSKLNTKVLTLETIYHEFSSGKQDIAAIRNCIRYIYQNSSNSETRLKYVNLFGDASYDYKSKTSANTNIVPIYHALRGNTVGESSFASDDFYGLMDIGEGNITNNFGGIDITLGRMLVADTKQAEEMVNKVIEYHDAKSYGSWRNNFMMIADDSDKASDLSLQFRQNQLSDIISSKKPFLNPEKILLDSYVQQTSAGGNRYPLARTDIFNAFEKGALIVNYLGHGGEDGLSAERIWEKSDGENLNNQYKYPLFVTITCDFSRFDNPSKQTAGEFVYWNPTGGAIGMITTIRSIAQTTAENFNDNLFKYLLSYESNEYTSIAESLRLAKNNTPSSSSNVIFYIGDPALMLAIPKPTIRLTKVNDIPISQSIADFKSLAKIKIAGEITDGNNNILANYNGEVATRIFDKTTSRKTLNNDGYSPSINFNVLGESIFRGNATITSGQFEFSFIVPRDIRIPLDNGKISFYATQNQTLEDKAGQDTSIKIGGVNENAPEDNINPIVQLYMNDETFVSGGITNSSPFLIALLEDESGINTASGIGHDITAVLDGDESNPYILNDYYQTNLDDYTKGTVRFPLRDITAGLHTLTFKAWDVYNNPTTTEIQFLVVGDETITLTNVLNYPNPFVNYTEFWFTHNRPFEPLEVQVQVYTVTGKVVWTKNQLINTDGFLSKEITWDGRDDFGNKIGKGVYVYKLTVKSSLTNKKAEKFEKLVIL